jgi:hypothetical protein
MRAVLEVVEKTYLDRLPHILAAFGIVVVSFALAFGVYLQKSGRPTEAPTNDAASVVVFEKSKCEPCETFRDGIGRKYQSSDMAGKANLRYYDVSDGPPPKQFKLKGELGRMPTTVVFDIYGREVSRLSGIPESVDVVFELVRPAVRRAERELSRINPATR